MPRGGWRARRASAAAISILSRDCFHRSDIIGDIAAGLYVTSLMGFGTNIVTGDYSRGATGLWIENGQLTHAVEEVTIAGNLAEMLMNVTSIGNDLEFRGGCLPTLRIDGMTVRGVRAAGLAALDRAC